MKKSTNVLENPLKKRYEEWQVQFTKAFGKEEMQKIKKIRLTPTLEEHTVLTLNRGKKFGSLEGTGGMTVMYFLPGEDVPFGGYDPE